MAKKKSALPEPPSKPKAAPVRRSDEGPRQPNLNHRCGARSLVRMWRRVKGTDRDKVMAFVTRHPAVERINPFGDPYDLEAVRLVWLEACMFEKLLHEDDVVCSIGKKMAARDNWSDELERLMRAAVQRVFETRYIPWLKKKFDEDIVKLCAEFALVSIGEKIRGQLEADEWHKLRKRGRSAKDYMKQLTTPKRKKPRGSTNP